MVFFPASRNICITRSLASRLVGEMALVYTSLRYQVLDIKAMNAFVMRHPK
jgi:hypothetical protein